MIGFAKAEAALRDGAKVMVTHSDAAQGGGVLVDQRADASSISTAEAVPGTEAGVGRAIRRRICANNGLGRVA